MIIKILVSTISLMHVPMLCFHFMHSSDTPIITPIIAQAMIP